MFFWKRNRYAKDIAQKIWPYVSHAERMGGINSVENPFLLGFISASCTHLLTFFEGKAPKNLDNGLVTLRVLQHCFGDSWKEVQKTSSSILKQEIDMQVPNPFFRRGWDAATTLWAFGLGIIEVNDDPTLKRINESAKTAAEIEYLRSNSPFPIPDDERGQLFMIVSSRVKSDAAGRERWDEVD